MILKKKFLSGIGADITYCIYLSKVIDNFMEGVFIVVLIVLVVILYFSREKELVNSKKIKEDLEFLNKKIDFISNTVREIKENQSASVNIQKSNVFEEFTVPQPEAEKKESLRVNIKEETVPEQVMKNEKPAPEEIPLTIEEAKPIYLKENLFTKPVKKQKSAIDFEKLFGENILSKIGITTLVLGIAYFVKYAIDKDWISEAGRVAIGVLVGLGIIGFAHKLREKYSAFSALLAGGGIAVLYITITIAFREYLLFSQTIAFVVLITITILSILLALYYNEKILAIFSLLGGFASPLLISTGTGDYVTLFSYIFILNTGMLVLAYKKKWMQVSLLSYVLTYIFYSTWLLSSFTVKERTGAVVFISLFFIQFYILVMIEYFKIRKITPYQVFIILTNNFLLYLSLLYIFHEYPVNVKGILTFSMAVINLIPVILLLKIREKDSLFFHLLLGVSITFISLTIPIQMKGSVITMFWGAEAVLLLWLFRKTRIEIFKFSFLVLEVLALTSLFIDYVKYYLIGEQILDLILNPIFITGVLVIIYLGINRWMLKKEEKTSFKLFKVEIFSFSFISKILNGVFVFLLFIFPFTELTYQLNIRNFSTYQVLLIQGVYIYLFAGIFIVVMRKHLKQEVHITIIILSILYSILYLGYIVSSAIEERFYTPNFSYGIFLLHLLTVPAFIVLLFNICKSKATEKTKDKIYWLVAIIAVIAISVETDNLVLMYYTETILGNVHTIVYPVIWGISALILIIVGMKNKKVVFRQISLALFALIILKLYLYDVWKMPQTGRIISFIVLGLILLGTSFLYQKLKVLVKINEEEKLEVETNKD